MTRMIAVTTLLVFLCTVCGPAASESTKLKLAHTALRTSGEHRGLEEFARLVGKRTSGRISVEVVPEGALGDGRFLFEQVGAGLIKAAAVSLVAAGEFVPQLGVIQIPFVFPDGATAHGVLDDPTVKNRLFKGFERKGVTPLGWTERGFLSLLNSRLDVRKPRHLMGLKLRVMQRPYVMETMRALATVPKVVPMPLLYDALWEDEVDGVEDTLLDSIQNRLTEVTRHVTRTYHCLDAGVVVVNRKFFESLPPEDQEVFVDAARVATRVNRDWNVRLEQKLPGLGISLEEYCRRNDVKVIDLSPSDRARFREKLTDVWKRYEELVGEELFEFFLAVVKRHTDG